LPIAVLVSLLFLLGLGMAWAWRGHTALAAQRLWRVRWPLGLLAGFAVWQGLQWVPLPQAFLSVLSPNAWQVHALAGSAWTLSLDPLQTRVQGALTLAYALAFVFVVLLARSQARLMWFAKALIALGVAQALLAIVLYSIRADYEILFFDVLHDRTKGSFGYHNHFAGYMELCLSVGIGLMLATMAGTAPQARQHWRSRLEGAFQFLLSPNMRLRLMLVVMVIALVLTRSRMGNAAFFVSMLLVGVLALWVFKRAKLKILALVISLVVVDLVVIGSWVGLDRVLDRVQGTELLIESGGSQESMEQRQMAAMDARGIVQDFPLFGTGAGSFATTFVRYQSPGNLYFDHAHNDYVEWLADHGWGGAVLIVGLVLSSLLACVHVLRHRRSRSMRGVALGVVMACLCLAIHSTVDFNLQLPANALTLVFVLALGWAAKLAPSIQSASRH
jgi:O-antigen ligase